MSKQRIYALLLILGSGFMFARTIWLVAGGILTTNAWWVSVLLFAEMLIDLGCLVCSIWWFVSNDPAWDRVPLRFGTAVVLLHALRVLIFALGRTGPWVNFDVKPEYRSVHDQTWSWGEVYFASIMAILSIIVIMIIWRIRVQNRKETKYDEHLLKP